jgi:hypoxanthine phosphoribosyltransferase
MCPRRDSITVSPASRTRASASVMMSNFFMYDPRPMSARRPSEILISAEQIQARVAEMAKEIRKDYPNGLHIVAVLKGAFIFLSDLARYMEGDVSMDFMAVSSYAKGTTSSGEVKLMKDLDTALDGKDVLIVEDIVDTGITLSYLQDILRARGPRVLRTACLLSKPSRRKTPVKVEYIGFTIEDRFVVGYGLDFAEQFRNLPYIGVIEA